MSGVTVDASELRGWGEAMAKVPDLMKVEIPNTVAAVSQHAANAAANAAPVDLGILKAGIVAMPAVWTGAGAEGAFASTAPYSKWVDQGRGPIVAKPGKMLRIPVSAGMKGIPGPRMVIFRKRVGPAAPRPFMKYGREWARKNLASMLEEKIAKILRAD